MRFFPTRAVLAISPLLLLCACETYPTMTERSEMLAPKAQYFPPETSGPAPLVILMSGCGGLVGSDGKPNTIMEKYARAANSAGAYAIIVDSFQPRGIDFNKAISTVCSGMQLRGKARAGDALAGEALAEAHWKTQFTGIILSGWSHGAWSITQLLDAGPDAKSLGNLQVGETRRALSPDAVTLFYPYCGILNQPPGKPWAFKGPMLFVTAEKDTIGKPEECAKIVEGGRPGMTGVEAITYPGMTHAFDEESQSEGSAFVYDPEVSAQAEATYSKFISEQVARLK
ncbi:MAG TPA: dienelactone hydrolase family protein [Hyphomonadaceae bacterium]|nr:dienelactone hydrolase family protein [Hyphomonadaceae bacterium]